MVYIQLILILGKVENTKAGKSNQNRLLFIEGCEFKNIMEVNLFFR